MLEKTDRVYKTKLTIASDVYLTDQEGAEYGGVILMVS